MFGQGDDYSLWCKNFCQLRNLRITPDRAHGCNLYDKFVSVLLESFLIFILLFPAPPKQLLLINYLFVLYEIYSVAKHFWAVHKI